MMHKKWLKEIKAEIQEECRQLAAERDHRACLSWSRDKATERTKCFYRKKVEGLAASGTISAKERVELLALVEGLGNQNK